MGGQGLDGGDKVVMGDPPVPPTRENPAILNITNFSKLPKVENEINDVIITVKKSLFLIIIQHYNHLRS